MAKLLLLSILIWTVGVPLYFARDRSAKRGLRRTVRTVAVIAALWLTYAAFKYREMSPGIDIEMPEQGLFIHIH